MSNICSKLQFLCLSGVDKHTYLLFFADVILEEPFEQIQSITSIPCSRMLFFFFVFFEMFCALLIFATNFKEVIYFLVLFSKCCYLKICIIPSNLRTKIESLSILMTFWSFDIIQMQYFDTIVLLSKLLWVINSTEDFTYLSTKVRRKDHIHSFIFQNR